jgi:cytochrome c biogenesis protein CcmG/thiol:disulfide interchange protein DsbE
MNKLPLIVFVLLAGLLGAALLSGKNPAIVDSVLIGKPAPTKLKGPAVVNFFASWCVECIVEQPALAKIKSVPVYGIAYKDAPEKTAVWLKKYGNPYKKVIHDRDGKIAIDWGVYGVPETYLIDKNGIIRDKVVGAVTDDFIRKVEK